MDITWKYDEEGLYEKQVRVYIDGRYLGMITQVTNFQVYPDQVLFFNNDRMQASLWRPEGGTLMREKSLS